MFHIMEPMRQNQRRRCVSSILPAGYDCLVSKKFNLFVGSVYPPTLLLTPLGTDRCTDCFLHQRDVTMG